MPIRVGDLVEYQSVRWFAATRRSDVRTAILRQMDGTSVEVADDDPGVKVLANVPTQWPFVALPRKSSPIESITVARGPKTFSLKPMQAWVPAEPLHNGGVVYFHPKTNLRHGEVLVAHHKDGSLTRVPITKNFGTVKRKLAIEQAKDPPPPPTRYDRLLQDDDD